MLQKTIIVCSTIFFFVATNVCAQSNPVEAKAAYLMAEESYAKADYSAAMKYIQQAKKSLGMSNCKILFLEIMVGRELFVKDQGGLDKTVEMIKVFEKSEDYPDFNEDKKIEISKLKLLIEKDYSDLKEKKARYAREAAELHAREEVFNKEHARFGPLFISIGKLDSLHPELNIKEWKRRKKFGTYAPRWVSIDAGLTPSEASPFCAVDKGSDFKDKIAVIFAYESIMEYTSVLVYNEKGKSGEDEALLEIGRIITAYQIRLGFAPVVTESHLSDRGKGNHTTYTWIMGNKKIQLHRLYYPNGRLGIVKLVEVIS